jgi:hypothetical protein
MKGKIVKPNHYYNAKAVKLPNGITIIKPIPKFMQSLLKENTKIELKEFIKR